MVGCWGCKRSREDGRRSKKHTPHMLAAIPDRQARAAAAPTTTSSVSPVTALALRHHAPLCRTDVRARRWEVASVWAWGLRVWGQCECTRAALGAINAAAMGGDGSAVLGRGRGHRPVWRAVFRRGCCCCCCSAAAAVVCGKDFHYQGCVYLRRRRRKRHTT